MKIDKISTEPFSQSILNLIVIFIREPAIESKVSETALE